MEEKMSSRILKMFFEFLHWQIAQTKSKLRNKFASFTIMRVVNRILDGGMNCRIFSLNVKKILIVQRTE